MSLFTFLCVSLFPHAALQLFIDSSHDSTLWNNTYAGNLIITSRTSSIIQSLSLFQCLLVGQSAAVTHGAQNGQMVFRWSARASIPLSSLLTKTDQCANRVSVHVQHQSSN